MVRTASNYAARSSGWSWHGDNRRGSPGVGPVWLPGARSDPGYPSFEVKQGQQLLLQGTSGSGKSTLLGLMSGVLHATSGRIEVAGHNLSSLAGTAHNRFRANHCGVIFQKFNLLLFLSVRDNIALGLNFVSRELRAHSRAERDKRISLLLEALGLNADALLARLAGRLSVGKQQQRVAAARALIGKPQLLLADEPTSALDPESARSFLRLLSKACRQAGTTAIVVSHDPSLEPLFDEVSVLDLINRASRPLEEAP